MFAKVHGRRVGKGREKGGFRVMLKDFEIKRALSLVVCFVIT